MRPGRGWKSFSSAIAGSGNVQKRQVRQGIEGRAHIAGGRRTLPDQRKTPAKTTDRSSRTLRPFIWPSVGCFPHVSPERPSSFPEARSIPPAFATAADRSEGAAPHCVGRSAARDRASWRGSRSIRQVPGPQGHCFGPAAEIATNRPPDCGAMAETSRTATTVGRSLAGGFLVPRSAG